MLAETFANEHTISSTYIQSNDCEDGFTGIDIISVQTEKLNGKMTRKSSFDYQEEWKNMFEHIDCINRLRTRGCKGHLRSSRFRSLCWKVYLDCLPDERSLWIKRTWEMRQEYKDIKEKLATNPRMEDNDLDLTLNNPLSQEDMSPWNKFFQDSELQVTIKQDVIRTFPEIDFFHTPDIQSMMVRILFCYARQFPDVSYRQGMHELLAPILFVLHSDQQALSHASEIDSIRLEIKELLDPEFTEPDAFFLFCQLMDIVEPWYITGDRRHHKMEHLNLVPFSQPPENGPNSVIEVKLTKIHEQLLKRHDLELYTHLKELEIAPPIYGIRWLRLLFGREFCMQDLLVVWDAIFSGSLTSDLVDYLFCAMLITIRELLLEGDYTKCLGYLMRYPAISDIRYIIDLALHLKDPLKCQKPANRGQLHLSSVPLMHPSNRPHSDRPKTLMLNEVFNREHRPSSEPATLDSKSPKPEALVPSGPAHHSKERLPSQNSTEKAEQKVKRVSHSRHWSANWEQLVTTDGISKGKKKELLKTGGLSQSLNQLDNSFKEMVPLSTPNWNIEKGVAASDSKEIPTLSSPASICRLQSMNDYCWRRMTLHLDRLQDGLLRQKLQNEDELLLAVAGLKRVRDILKGTLTFSEEVINDEEYGTIQENQLVWSVEDDPWQIVESSVEITEPTSASYTAANSNGKTPASHIRRNGPREPLPAGLDRESRASN